MIFEVSLMTNFVTKAKNAGEIVGITSLGQLTIHNNVEKVSFSNYIIFSFLLCLLIHPDRSSILPSIQSFAFLSDSDPISFSFHNALLSIFFFLSFLTVFLSKRKPPWYWETHKKRKIV